MKKCHGTLQGRGLLKSHRLSETPIVWRNTSDTFTPRGLGYNCSSCELVKCFELKESDGELRRSCLRQQPTCLQPCARLVILVGRGCWEFKRKRRVQRGVWGQVCVGILLRGSGRRGGRRHHTVVVWSYHAKLDCSNLKNTSSLSICPDLSICPGPHKSVLNSRISHILGLSLYLENHKKWGCHRIFFGSPFFRESIGQYCCSFRIWT